MDAAAMAIWPRLKTVCSGCSYRSIGEIGKISNLGSDGVCRSIFTLNTKNGKGQKLHSNIKIHGKQTNSSFQFPKIPNIATVAIWGISGTSKQTFVFLKFKFPRTSSVISTFQNVSAFQEWNTRSHNFRFLDLQISPKQ